MGVICAIPCNKDGVISSIPCNKDEVNSTVMGFIYCGKIRNEIANYYIKRSYSQTETSVSDLKLQS